MPPSPDGPFGLSELYLALLRGGRVQDATGFLMVARAGARRRPTMGQLTKSDVLDRSWPPFKDTPAIKGALRHTRQIKPTRCASYSAQQRVA
jgi:hypothetical protein